MQKIHFNPVSKIAEQTVPRPKPAREYMPQWYKEMPAFKTPKPKFDLETAEANKTLKHCVPFSDAMTMGYIQESWVDMNFEFYEDGTFSFFESFSPHSVNFRQDPSMPVPEEFHQIEFVFNPQWVPEVPSGYSVLWTHPLNHTDLPFHVLSGVVDSDKFTQSLEKSSLPFYMKKSFSGIIPKGTPLFQYIPIKRDSWESFENKYNEEAQRKMGHMVKSKFWGGYKKYFWTKKIYS